MQPSTNEDQQQEGSVRDTLSRAFEQDEARSGAAESDVGDGGSAAQVDETPAQVEDAETEASEIEATKAGRSRDASGRFAKGAKAAEPEEGAQEPATAQQTAPADQGVQPAAAPKPAALKAPQSWTPAEREEFAKASPAMQAAALRREGEIQRTLNDSAISRKAFETIQKIVDPHMPLLRAQGLSPYQAIENMFRTANTLTHGSRQTKAGELARLVAESMPNLEDLKAFDEALQIVYGGGKPGAPQPQPQGEFKDPRLDKLLSDLESQRAANQQRQHEELVNGYGKFAETHEYFHDVRHDMAALIQSRAEKGIVLDDETAYNLALKLHPEIDAIVQQRRAAATARKGNPSIERARNAASSIRGTPAGEKAESPPDDVRGAVEASIRKLETRR